MERGEKNAFDQEKLLDVEQVATLLNLGVRTVWRYEKDGKIPASKRYGRKKVWDEDDLKLWWQLGRPTRTEFETLKKRG